MNTTRNGHTPGPWRIGGSAVADKATDYCIVVDGNDSRPKILAEAYGRADWEHPFPSADNARLISAAPDLLAALKATLTHAEAMTCEIEDTDDLSEFPYIQTARAIIAKATGNDETKGQRS